MVPTLHAKASANMVGVRVAGVVAGTLLLFLALLASVRPRMMSMAALQDLLSETGL